MVYENLIDTDYRSTCNIFFLHVFRLFICLFLFLFTRRVSISFDLSKCVGKTSKIFTRYRFSPPYLLASLFSALKQYLQIEVLIIFKYLKTKCKVVLKLLGFYLISRNLKLLSSGFKEPSILSLFFLKHHRSFLDGSFICLITIARPTCHPTPHSAFFV